MVAFVTGGAKRVSHRPQEFGQRRGANRVRTSTFKPIRRMCSISVTASREWPPNSKKLSYLPTLSSFSTSASFSSVSSRGGS
jgi:hypothetical protein